MKLRDFLLAVHWLSKQNLKLAQTLTLPPTPELITWV